VVFALAGWHLRIEDGIAERPANPEQCPHPRFGSLSSNQAEREALDNDKIRMTNVE